MKKVFEKNVYLISLNQKLYLQNKVARKKLAFQHHCETGIETFTIKKVLY